MSKIDDIAPDSALGGRTVASAEYQLAQTVTPSLPSLGGQQATPPAPPEPTPSAPSAPSAPTISPSIPNLSGGSVVAPSLPGTPAPVTPAMPSAPTTAPSTSSDGINVILRNPDNVSIPAGSSQVEVILRDGNAVAPIQQPESGGLGFLEILTALILALIIAPVLQKESGKWLKNLNALDFVRRNGVAVSTYLLVFTFGWIFLMIILPQLYMFDFSFRFNLPPPEVGGPNDVYTLKNYRYLIFGREGSTEMLNWLHLGVFFKTVIASVLVTVFNFLLCYPLAYYMAQSVSGRSQRLLFLCLLLPFWINEILRAFAFKLIFADLGLINSALVGLGIWDTPYDFMRADIALYTGLTYAYLLLMIFPLYNAIESLDHNQVEAARDMGASWLKIHLRIVMPYAKPGIASGCTMVFMLSAGALAAPAILGGPSSLWFTQIIYQWYNTGGNWPQGSAYSFVLLIACIVFVMTMMRLFKVSLGDLAKR